MLPAVGGGYCTACLLTSSNEPQVCTARCCLLGGGRGNIVLPVFLKIMVRQLCLCEIQYHLQCIINEWGFGGLYFAEGSYNFRRSVASVLAFLGPLSLLVSPFL